MARKSDKPPKKGHGLDDSKAEPPKPPRNYGKINEEDRRYVNDAAQNPRQYGERSRNAAVNKVKKVNFKKKKEK